IARAWLRDPVVLVLDEPTAALDPASEQSLAETLVEARSGRTAIIITHRLALVELADQVIVLENGRVVEAGRPEAVLSRGSRLSNLFRQWERQEEFRSRG